MILSLPVRHARLAVIGQALDAGDTGGLLCLYSGQRPPAPTAWTDQCLLAELPLAKPAVARLEAGRLTFAPVPSALCLRSGLVGWARLTDGAGRWVADLTVGQEGSEAELTLTSLQLLKGGTVQLGLAELDE